MKKSKYACCRLFIVLWLVINSISSNAADFYWVGGTGDWSDFGSHWAATSGGVVFHATIPGPLDDVYFDANSFSGANDTVYLDSTLIYCRTMDWTGAINNPVFINKANVDFNLYGSLTLIAGMNYMINKIVFKSTAAGNTIFTAGHNLNAVFFYDSGGGWMLSDALNAFSIAVSRGTLNTNNQDVNCSHFTCGGAVGYPASLQLGTSVISTAYWYASPLNFTLNATASTIISTNFQAGPGLAYGDVIAGLLSMDNNSFHDITVTGYGFIGTNATVHQAIFSGTSIIDSENTFQKAIFTNGGTIRNNNTFDTLILACPGATVRIRDTVTVNSAMWTDALPGFPISLQSEFSGANGHITSPSGNTVCLDYIYMQDMDVTGGASFYAGDHSVDLGNNTGWTWSSCTPDTSNVWPGDANYDLTADNIDILYIGLAYGYTGPIRAGATTNWVAQPGIDWLQQFATGYNIKHADCDGSGVVDATDTNAVVLNYGQVHPFKQPFPSTVTGFGTPLYFDLPTGALTPGSAVDIPIMFGTANVPADKFYGVAFTVNYDPSLIQSGSVEIIFSNSWFGNGTNTMHINKDFYSNGNIDMAFTKTDHTDEAGYGQFATLHFVLDNNASGPLNLSFSKILVMDKYEIPQPVNVINGSVYTGVNDLMAGVAMMIYPNPATDQIKLVLPGHQIISATIINATGSGVYHNSYSNDNVFDVKNLANGIYFIELTTDKGIFRQKFIVNH